EQDSTASVGDRHRFGGANGENRLVGEGQACGRKCRDRVGWQLGHKGVGDYTVVTAGRLEGTGSDRKVSRICRSRDVSVPQGIHGNSSTGVPSAVQVAAATQEGGVHQRRPGGVDLRSESVRVFTAATAS